MAWLILYLRNKHFACWVKFACFFVDSWTLSKLTPSVSNSLDPDQARHYVGPDLGPNCLQWLSADDTVATSRERVKFLKETGRKLVYVAMKFDLSFKIGVFSHK